MNPVEYVNRRNRELKEWWLLRKRDPRALDRQRLREDVARRAEAENQAWLAGQTGSEFGMFRPDLPAPPYTGADLPNPRGPKLVEVGAIVAILFVVVIIATVTNPVEPARPRTAAGVSQPQGVTATTGTDATDPSSSQSAAPDLKAVPVGRSQTIEGVSKNDGTYKAKVTVKSVTRTSDTNLTVDVEVSDISGVLPMTSAWKLVTRGGQEISMNLYGDNALGSELSADAAGTVDAYVDADTKLASIRLQPPSGGMFSDSTNATAVWTIGEVATSMTPTPTYPTSDNTDGGADSDIDIPDVDAPNLPGCINGRDRKGRFC